jgi:hypothetical protein
MKLRMDGAPGVVVLLAKFGGLSAPAAPPVEMTGLWVALGVGAAVYG